MICENCCTKKAKRDGLCKSCFLSMVCQRCRTSGARKALMGLCFKCFDEWDDLKKEVWEAFMKGTVASG